MKRSLAGAKPAVFRPTRFGNGSEPTLLPPLPTREECRGGPRPCPLVRCRQNLYLDVTAIGSIRMNFPDREPWDMPPAASCALDIAERGAATLEEVGCALNITRERARQLIPGAVRQVRVRLVVSPKP